MSLLLFLILLFAALIIAGWIYESKHPSVCNNDCSQGRYCKCQKSDSDK